MARTPPRRRPPTQRRPCLRCDREFPSEGAHHRLCTPCRQALMDESPGPEPRRLATKVWREVPRAD